MNRIRYFYDHSAYSTCRVLTQRVVVSQGGTGRARDCLWRRESPPTALSVVNYSDKGACCNAEKTAGRFPNWTTLSADSGPVGKTPFCPFYITIGRANSKCCCFSKVGAGERVIVSGDENAPDGWLVALSFIICCDKGAC